MRIFIGIFPSYKVTSQFRDVIRSMDKIKRNFVFVNFEQVHLTIKFLGNSVSKESYDIVADRLQEISRNLPNPMITIDNLYFGFGNQKNPTVIFFPIVENKEIIELSSIISKEIKQLNLDDTIRTKERKKMIHHITIARSKRSISNSLVRNTRKVINDIQVPTISFPANEISLIESSLLNTGPVYRKLNIFPLKKQK